MHRINKEFDKVICINLAERKDKRERMESRFSRLGITTEWFTAVQYGFIPKILNPIVDSKVGNFNKNQPFEIGAALSHYHVIKQALAEGCEKIFVFEDDAKFHFDFNNKFNSYMNILPENWDILLLYSFMYQLNPENTRINSKWIRSFNSWSLMSYGINKKAMQAYIKSQDNFFTISDRVTYEMQNNNEFNIYSAVPTLCIPEPNSSNIRSQANYIQNPTIINLGIKDDNYS